MAHRHARLYAVLVVTALALPVSLAYAQAKEDRVTGTVQIVNKDTSTIVVRAEAGEEHKQVVYDAATKITKDNKPGAIEDVSSGKRVICLGKLNDKGQLLARAIDVRPAS
jgi:hypothetical protein